MTGERRIIASSVGYLILVLVIFLGHLPHHVWSQDAAGSRNAKPRLSPLFSNIFLGRFNRTVEKYEPAIEREIGFCTENVKKDFDGAFDFRGREEFFQNCQEKLHAAAHVPAYLS